MTQTFQIQINEKSRIPKYKQIVDSIIADISNGNLKVGEKIPSINELSESCYLSRDTVEKAYKQLKERKVIISVKGKGYYTAKTDLISKANIFFLVNKPSTYKMIIYNSFVDSIGVNGHVNMFIYHCDESLFIKSLERNMGAYDYYVIMPHFRDENSNHVSYTENVIKVLEQIPKDKLIMLDNTKPGISGNYGAIYQDFQNDIYKALNEGLERIKKYDKIILVYPSKSANPYPRRILHGFQQFCWENNLDFEILDEIYDEMDLQSKDAYITIQERDLVNLVRQVRKKKLVLGKDIGIISYNETPLKELLGITVISTDFKTMGETAAYMLLKNKKEKVKNVFKYIERNSV
ncbi:transcriptional regulator [Salegentibacter salinarum]|uniref:Transcriptional regulator n=1 Tax=Salegentibacter salinarum TaxID=447422 RepID=A0A2N0TSR8_9FLAO|nr:GntR family transcriptional regulator [Salegentibacter salinarum]PKD17718.1 transcriptional regulator [Salegentibacter salinarum]SKB51438.1 substrate-binding protein-like domain-containing protein [Salegentibacter salinarum]